MKTLKFRNAGGQLYKETLMEREDAEEALRALSPRKAVLEAVDTHNDGYGNTIAYFDPTVGKMIYVCFSPNNCFLEGAHLIEVFRIRRGSYPNAEVLAEDLLPYLDDDRYEEYEDYARQHPDTPIPEVLKAMGIDEEELFWDMFSDLTADELDFDPDTNLELAEEIARVYER